MSGGKKWEKGQSGNPSGRPKSNFSFRKELDGKLGEVNEKDYLKRTYGRIIIGIRQSGEGRKQFLELRDALLAGEVKSAIAYA